MNAEHRIIVLCPAANRDIGNAMADSPEFGGLGPVFSVPLSDNGGQTVTHYGCHAWVDGAFLGMLAGRADVLAGYGCQYVTDLEWDDFLTYHGLEVVILEEHT